MVGHRKESSFWETRFDELAIFNSEVSRGIQHTPDKRERMKKLQADYNVKMMANAPGEPPARENQKL